MGLSIYKIKHITVSKTTIQKETPKKISSFEYQPLKKSKKDTFWKI